MAWYQVKGNDSDTVFSSRIRFARNLSGFRFEAGLSTKDAEEIISRIENALGKEYIKTDMCGLSALQAQSLVEQHLISRDFASKKTPHALFRNDNKSLSVMALEEDHIRLQCILPGLSLRDAYRFACECDDKLDSALDLAYDESLGYLTHCPTNLGTGMRASVMMFLPGLTENGGLKKLLPSMKAEGMTVRGAFGEGTNAEGYFYQISNERTLGLTESELLGQMSRATMAICDLEIRAREEMVKRSGIALLDKCLRAYGTLTHCALLTYKEFLEKMSDVRLGMALDFFEVRDYAGFEDFFTAMRPATFRASNGLQGVSEKKCDEIRAETVGVALPELVGLSRKNKLKK